MNLSPRYSVRLNLNGAPGTEIVLELQRFFVGPRGPSGAESQVSADSNNAISVGSDGGLFAPRDPFLATNDW